MMDPDPGPVLNTDKVGQTDLNYNILGWGYVQGPLCRADRSILTIYLSGDKFKAHTVGQRYLN